MSQPIDVVIATMCEEKRAELLLRAIDSVVTQQGVVGRPIVVVNGQRFHPPLVAKLKARSDIRLIQLDAASVFLARRVGFEAVTSAFFGILDDDDVFLPGALKRRLQVIEVDKTVDWVVSNGMFVWPTVTVPYIENVDAVRRDPYGTLLKGAWLCSAGNLFRTAVAHPDMFDAVRSMEITYLAFRLLAEGRRVVFLDEPTFKYFYYPDSLSKKDHYNLPAAETLRAMMQLPAPAWVRSGLAKKYRRAMHDVCEHHRKHGEIRKAWAAHLKSVGGLPQLFHYMVYTRTLVADALRGAFGISTNTDLQASLSRTDLP